MAQKTQRVENLLKNFMHYHESGYSIKEIAEIFEVDLSTIYNYLQEIADANNVSRECLLERNSSTFSRLPLYKEKVDVEKLRNDFKSLDTSIDNIISSIDKILLTL